MNKIYYPYPANDGKHKYYIITESGKKIKFGAGAQFIVSKKNILKHPKSFYLKIVKLLEYDVNPPEGFVIERFHGLILNNI